jgi:hypothetical protein
MEAVPISVVLLRALLPDVKLTPGAVVSARVLDPKTITLAGVRMAATLPEGVVEGQVLRLRVEESTTERIHLKIVAPPQAQPAADPAEQAPQVPASAYQLALPGGILARIHVEEREAAGRKGGAGAAASVVVRYDSPSLGRLDVRLTPDSAAIHVTDGDPALTVADAAEVLRDALARATGRGVQVTVHPRGRSYDQRA